MQILNAFFRLIRIGNLLIIALSLTFFYYLILVPVHHNKLQTGLLPFVTSEFVMFVLSVVFVAAAGNIINDYFDFELDKEYKPTRPLPQGIISLDNALYLHAILAFAGIGLGFYLGWKNSNIKIGYLYIICVLLLYVYSSTLKKIPLAGNFVVSALTAFIFVLLLLFEANFLNTISFETGPYVLDLLLWQVKFYGGFAFITNFAREVVKDMEDVEGDAAYNINTIAVQYGISFAKAIAGFTLIVLLIALGWVIKGFYEAHAIREASYLVIAVGLPTLLAIGLIIRARQQTDYAKIGLVLKIIMLLGILSIPVFYFINLQPAA